MTRPPAHHLTAAALRSAIVPGPPPVPRVRWEIVIPRWRPATVNELMRSVRDRIRLKRRDRDMIAAYMLKEGVPRATGKRRVSIRLALGPRNRRPDADNLWKSLLDGCTHSGLIVDDGPDHCEMGPVTYQLWMDLETTIIIENIV